MSGFQRRLVALGSLLGLCLAANGCNSSASGSGCSEATLKGTYVWAYDGFQITGDQAAQRVPLAFAGRDVWNGDGTMTGAGSGGINGAIARTTANGVYVLNADCTGTLTQTDSEGVVSHWDLYVLNDGALLTYVETDEGYVASGVEQRAS